MSTNRPNWQLDSPNPIFKQLTEAALHYTKPSAEDVQSGKYKQELTANKKLKYLLTLQIPTKERTIAREQAIKLLNELMKNLKDFFLTSTSVAGRTEWESSFCMCTGNLWYNAKGQSPGTTLMARLPSQSNAGMIAIKGYAAYEIATHIQALQAKSSASAAVSNADHASSSTATILNELSSEVASRATNASPPPQVAKRPAASPTSTVTDQSEARTEIKRSKLVGLHSGMEGLQAHFHAQRMLLQIETEETYKQIHKFASPF